MLRPSAPAAGGSQPPAALFLGAKMAILKLGELVSGIRGTIGGTVYSANQAGPYAKRWAKGTNPHTTPQSVIRSTLSSHSAYWQALDQADRDLWDAYAALPAQELINSLGEVYYASGFNWFCRNSSFRLAAGQTRRTQPPTDSRPTAPTIDAFTAQTPITTSADMLITHPYGEFYGLYIIVFLAFATPSTLSFARRGFLLTLHDQIWHHTEFGFGLETLSMFGNPIENSRAYVKVARQSVQAQRSPYTTFSTIVTG